MRPPASRLRRDLGTTSGPVVSSWQQPSTESLHRSTGSSPVGFKKHTHGKSVDSAAESGRPCLVLRPRSGEILPSSSHQRLLITHAASQPDGLLYLSSHSGQRLDCWLSAPPVFSIPTCTPASKLVLPGRSRAHQLAQDALCGLPHRTYPSRSQNGACSANLCSQLLRHKRPRDIRRSRTGNRRQVSVVQRLMVEIEGSSGLAQRQVRSVHDAMARHDVENVCHRRVT